MSSYPNLGPVGQEYIAEQEYKALFGYPSGKVNLAFNQEVPGTSRISVFQNQVFSREIPATAPVDLSAKTDVVITRVSGGATVVAGKKQTSTAKPYIAYYTDLVLNYQQLTPTLTYWFLGADTTYSANRTLQVKNIKFRR